MSAPADFIPVAEESALIVEIGAWTLMQACHESAAGLRRRRGRAGDLASTSRAASSRSPTCPALVADCLRSSGLPAAAAAARAQGAVLQGAPKTARGNLEELRTLGVGLALDDFGTGYSSLRDLPVAAVKIDRSFVAQLGHDAGRHGDRGRDHLAGRARWGSTRSPRASRTRRRRRCCASSAARSRRAICSARPAPRITSGP